MIGASRGVVTDADRRGEGAHRREDLLQSARGRSTRRARGCHQREGRAGHRYEIVLTVDREWRRTRLFRSDEQAELVGAIADTRAMFEAKGWE
jgi:hypothetical protein